MSDVGLSINFASYPTRAAPCETPPSSDSSRKSSTSSSLCSHSSSLLHSPSALADRAFRSFPSSESCRGEDDADYAAQSSNSGVAM